MVTRACDPEKPSLEKSLSKNRENLDKIFQELFHDFNCYKLDVNDDDAFNGVDENEKVKYEHNDAWMLNIEEDYFALIDKSDDKLEILAKQKSDQSEQETKPDLMEEKFVAEELKMRKLFEGQIKSEKQAINDSITLTSNTVSAFASNSIGSSQGQAVRGSLHDISSRMDDKLQKLYEQLLKLLREEEVETFQTEFLEFINMQRARIDSIEMAIVAKTKEAPVATLAGRSGHSGSGHTYLKKVEPPKFSGDLLDFPEFKRRWHANVTRENLEEESELDRLRDNIPETAKKMLIGEKSLESAWKILTKLYGNKTMIANKLKGKLKNIKSSGEEDHNVVIGLAVEVKSIVKNLTELKMQDMLKYDDEYLSAIFRAMPSQARNDWLKYDKDKFDSVWEAMEKYLEEAHEIATNTKVLLSSYATSKPVSEKIRCKKCHEYGHYKYDCPRNPTVKVNAVKSRDADSSDDEENQSKRIEKLKLDLKESFGKCPLCKARHTFKKKRDGQVWPSDRMSSCEEFRKLSEKDRAASLEKHKACPRCLSWMHGNDSKDCRAPKNNCFKDKDGGAKCNGDHSRMVCGSGNVYCASAKFSKSLLHDTSTDSSSDSASLDVDAETLMLLEDIKVKSGDSYSECRNIWDSGSNRILINNDYAKEQNLRSHEVTYKLAVVGGKETIEKGVIHEIEVVENDGTEHKVWGFGIDTIMEPPEPVDMHVVRHLFPHVHAGVFDSLSKKRIDMLVGLNFFSLHPDGGQGINCVGNLKMLHSKFSKGWLLGGSHPDLLTTSSNLTSSALTVARVCRVEVKPVFGIQSDVNFKPQYSMDFWQADGLGVLPPKRCCRCMKCSDCNDAALIHSRKEQDELELCQKSIKLEN